jgi:uncharacterized protein YqjF (DUF2071 family)
MTLDRISPSTRPSGDNAGTQRWRELLFVHWTFAPEIVRPLVPREVELDAWDGRMYVGLVPFRMQEIRPSWLPRALALDFLELNLRTYVHYRGRPAVWFFSLEASSWLAVRAARAGWSLPYHHATMSVERDGERVRYASARRDASLARFAVDYEIGEPLGASKPGTLDHFLLERYLLLSQHRGVIHEGQVHHVPYPAHRAHVRSIDETLLAAAGLPPHGQPETAHFSPGVDVEVFGPFPVV